MLMLMAMQLMMFFVIDRLYWLCAEVCARGFLGFLNVYNDLRKSCSACSAGWNKGQTNSSAVLLGVIDLCSNNKNINN
jgi:hypothetical protein